MTESKHNVVGADVRIENLQFKEFESILYPKMNFKGGTFLFKEDSLTDREIEFITRKISIKGSPTDKVPIKTYDSVSFFDAKAN